MNDLLQQQLYTLFLEEYLGDLEMEMFWLKAKLTFKELDKHQEVPGIQRNPFIPQGPWETKYGKIDQCPKCGLKLEGVMSYSCQNMDCPTGMGPVWCKT